MVTQTPVEVSEEFAGAIQDIINALRYHEDPALRYMLANIPIYAQWEPTGPQRRAGGCPNCTYLGLWANQWPGYTQTQHGIIWLFERGIRGKAQHEGIDLYDATAGVLLHELDHALQRDHILESLYPTVKERRVRIAPCLKRPC